MPTPSRRRTAAGALASVATVIGATSLLASRPSSVQAVAPAAPVFGAVHNLGPAGGEPSIQDDGRGNVFITTPLGTGSIGGTGVLFSRSLDGGNTFLPATHIGGTVGGSDSDVVSDRSGRNLWVADLAAAFTNVLHSIDGGATFPTNVMTGPEDDREWLTPSGSTLYLTYHDFALNIPLIFGSTDQGQTFLPLGFGGTGQIIAPTDPAFADTKCNTVVGKPVVDAQGAIYVLTNSSTAAEDLRAGCALPGPLDRLWMSVSTDGGNSFTTSLVNDVSAATTGSATSGSWGHVFNQLAIDAGGNLYIDASGTLNGSLPLQNYLMVSKDHGKTWSKPIATAPSPDAQLFPAIAVGQAGQVAVGYYQGTKPDHRVSGNNFQFVIDETLDALDPAPSFSHVQLQPKPGAKSAHPDGICTDGIFCGTPASSGGNRNLADFESMAVDPAGHLEVIIPADSDGSTTENWFYKQTAGPLLVPGATNGNGTGNQTWVGVTGPRPTPTPTVAPAASPTPATQPNTSASGGAAGAGVVSAVVLIAVAGLLAAAPRRLRRSRRS